MSKKNIDIDSMAYSRAVNQVYSIKFNMSMIKESDEFVNDCELDQFFWECGIFDLNEVSWFEKKEGGGIVLNGSLGYKIVDDGDWISVCIVDHHISIDTDYNFKNLYKKIKKG